MKIIELLDRDLIILKLKASTKLEVIEELVDKLNSKGKLNSREEFRKAILEREGQSTTGIGKGIAIPHARTSVVNTPALVFGYSKEGIDYNSLDGQPAHIFFMIASKEGDNDDHLETLSRLSRILRKEDIRKRLMTLESKDELLNLLEVEEELILEKQRNKANALSNMVLAVTACPTGIAHTYMAADALEEKGKEMGVEIKVETNGSAGIKNRLTEEDIKKASVIIVAADKQIEMARFDGKKVIQVPVALGIKEAEKLINRAVSGEASVYNHTERGYNKTGIDNRKSLGLYKHLMSGVSNTMPFAVSGGVLISIALILEKNGFVLDNPSLQQFIKFLIEKSGVSAFTLMVPILAGFIGMSIADRPGFAPAAVGGLIAANSGAGFLGGLVAGFLGGYIILLIKRLFSKLPSSLEAMKPSLIYPVLGVFITTGIMLFVIVEPIGRLNLSLQTWLSAMETIHKIILGLVLGGMMAVDMGGPINKTAFTFGIAMIEAGNLGPHAAVMAGGMVPTLGIAMATTLFRNRFTEGERKAGRSCYIMGASFITEGAIPFAAKDPKRVIPSIIIGSAIAGALTMVFDIGMPTPLGGIFIIPIVEGNPLLYVTAILTGSFITASILGLLKKTTSG
ncbi:fructose-specific PTS transporter subunit EIIC [Wukongibacter baidiensis]|uniref:PTS fructose transporter subunit IIABC n=1 Tax=Wukongibacter baidiensis TaxID=1723361 RepID=UPI003D7FCCD2